KVRSCLVSRRKPYISLSHHPAHLQLRLFMPRDNDKNNDSPRGRRDGPPKGRSGKPRGPEKKFAKRGFAGKRDGDKRDGERRPQRRASGGAICRPEIRRQASIYAAWRRW